MSVSWDALPRDALKPFLEKSDWMALRMLAFNLGLIAASFALVMWAPAWYTVAIAMTVLGARQLGLGILTHECAHRSFLKSPAMGEWVGIWLCGAPMLVDLAIYRRYHMTHHVKTGTAADPDLANYANYPVSRKSLLRKFGRDLIGLSGVRALLSLLFLYGQQDAERMLQGYSYQSAAGDASAATERRQAGHNRRCGQSVGTCAAPLSSMGLCWRSAGCCVTRPPICYGRRPG